jgi:histidyl-tRNA synthetase
MGITKVTAIRGMNDVLPQEIAIWHFIEDTFQELVEAYGYQEIRTPIVEDTALFLRSIGAATDIIEKETYTFTDRNGDSLTLRPEGTAGTVRAGIEHGLFYNQVQRLWYRGPIFRHERPQKGRYRQFYQMGLEAFGMPGPQIDSELLLLTWRLWNMLGLAMNVELQINTLGLLTERLQYRAKLVDYFSQYKQKLDEDSLRRLDKNPLRILDSKNPDMQELILHAPSIQESLGTESLTHFNQIKQQLTDAGIPFAVNPRLVRGLDYYCHTVFEWVSTDLGAQGTVCAGGRYDGLVAELGSDNVPAVGLAMGIERLVLLLQQQQTFPLFAPEVYFINVGERANHMALILAERLRDQIDGLKIQTDCTGASMKSQLKKADKSAARIALILGDEEVERNSVTIKYLREAREQEQVAMVAIAELLVNVLRS